MTATPPVPLAAADPLAVFTEWFARAEAEEPNDPNAMTLATAARNGLPSARIVLLKEWDARGFVFYSNRESRKGEELADNPEVALLFHWKSLRRQVRIEGRAAPVTDAEADAYYASRPRLSRIGAWASSQSRELSARGELERRVAEFEARFPGEAIPRPPHWSGWRVVPARFEFWQDMPFRLHDRTVFTRSGETSAGPIWATMKLFP